MEIRDVLYELDLMQINKGEGQFEKKMSGMRKSVNQR